MINRSAAAGLRRLAVAAATWSAARASSSNTGWRFSWGSRRRDRQHRRRHPVTARPRPGTISSPARLAPCVDCTSSPPAPNACSTGPSSSNRRCTSSNSSNSNSNRRRCPSSRYSARARCLSSPRPRSTPAPIRPRPPWPRSRTTRRTRTVSTTRWAFKIL